MPRVRCEHCRPHTLSCQGKLTRSTPPSEISAVGRRFRGQGRDAPSIAHHVDHRHDAGPDRRGAPRLDGRCQLGVDHSDFRGAGIGLFSTFMCNRLCNSKTAVSQVRANRCSRSGSCRTPHDSRSGRRTWQSGQSLVVAAPRPRNRDLKRSVARRPSSRLGRSGASAGLLGPSGALNVSRRPVRPPSGQVGFAN